MALNWFDISLLLALAGFVFYGLFFGLIRVIGSLCGLVAGAYLAGQYYLIVFDWLKPVFFGRENLGMIITFIIIFGLASRIVAWLFSLIDKALHLLSIIPFLQTINRLAGAALGFLLGSLTLGLLIYVCSRYTLTLPWFVAILPTSQIAPWLLGFSGLLIPLLPKVLQQLKSLI